MKRETTTKRDGSKLIGFLQDFMVKANDNIHNDLENSQDWLAKHEVEDYLDDDGLRADAVEANEELTVEDVLQIGINFARTEIHRNWHEAMEIIAKKHGVTKLLEDMGGQHKETTVKVITDPSNLPPEVMDLLADALGLGDEWREAKRKKKENK